MKKNKLLIATPVVAIILYTTMTGFFKKKKEKMKGNEQRITLTGKASNKGGLATVVSDSAGTYIMWGMERWESNWEDHRIKVIGDLKNDLKGNKVFIKDAVVQMLNDE
jgi:hypothetical protein